MSSQCSFSNAPVGPAPHTADCGLLVAGTTARLNVKGHIISSFSGSYFYFSVY